MTNVPVSYTHLDENTKLWYSSTLSLYEALEKEKTEQKKVQKDRCV